MPEIERAHILVVDDDSMVRTVMADGLRDTGAVVGEAANADEALEYFGAKDRIDLVVTDIRMPGSMNGVDLARRIAKEYPTTAIVLVSGGDTVLANETCFTFIPKPFRIQNFVATVWMSLKR